MVLSLLFDKITYNLWPLTNEHQPNQDATVIQRIGHHVYLANLVDHSHSIVQKVAIKIAYNNELSNLQKEANFYGKELLGLQGTVVPRCLGFFRGQDEMGGFIGCLILEYCQGTIETDMAEFGYGLIILTSNLTFWQPSDYGSLLSTPSSGNSTRRPSGWPPHSENGPRHPHR